MSRYTDEERERIRRAGQELNPYFWADDGHDGGHVDYVCPGTGYSCKQGSCMFCDGGLFACSACGSFEGATTTDCPGRRIHLTDEVYAGRLDYRVIDGVGRWVAGPSTWPMGTMFAMACERAGVRP